MKKMLLLSYLPVYNVFKGRHSEILRWHTAGISMFCLLLCGVITNSTFAQTTIVNYSFNFGNSYGTLSPVLAPNINCTVTGSSSFENTYGTGTGSNAFASNSSGYALRTNVNTSRTFTITGVNLSGYKTFKVYYQAQKGVIGTNAITVSYSKNGGAFTSTGTTSSVGGNPLSITTLLFPLWKEAVVTLPSSADNPVTSLAIKLTINNKSFGTIDLDNFQVQASTSMQVTGFAGNKLCAGSTGQLVVTTSGGVAPYTIVYNDGIGNRTATGVVSGTAFNVAVTPTVNTNYTLVSVTDANGLVRKSGFTDAIATLSPLPLPTVNTVSNQAVCNGAATAAISFSGTVSGTTFAWTNNTAAIGLPATGTGNISSFTAINTSTSLLSATINVTPVANGCTGSAKTFSIAVNPSPTVSLAGSNQSISSTTVNTKLSANTPVAGQGVWSIVSGPSLLLTQFSNTADPVATFTPAGGIGVYTLRWTISNANCLPSASTVTISVTAGVNIAPIAKAGNDTSIALPANSVTLNATKSSDADGTIAGYAWKQLTGTTANITSPANAITSINNLTEGVYGFELTVTDNNGAISSDTVQVTVNTRLLIDVGATQTVSPDNGGKFWNNMTDASTGIRVQNAVTTANASTTINLEVVNRIDGTYDVNGTGLGGANTIGVVGDYPETATNDFAFAHPSTVNGNWKFTGLDASKQYTIKFWGTKSAADRFTQIKRSDETNWQEYDAGNNTDYNRAATFTFSGKTAMSFDIRVKTGYVFGYVNVVDILRTSGVPVTPPTSSDSDVVNCGQTFTIAVLGSSTAYGNGATPIDSSWVNKYTSYVKRKNASSTVINLGVPGFTTYNALCPDGFQPPANRPAPSSGNNITTAISLHPDAIIINLPTNDAVNDYSLAEQQANYERTMALADAAHIPVWVTTTQPRNGLTATQVNNLKLMKDWIYTRFGTKAIDFWTTLANADGTIVSAYDYDGIHVNNAGHDIFYRRVLSETILDTLCNAFNGAPVAKAGNDTTIILPASTAALNGTASVDADGVIVNYQWEKITGPPTFQIADASASSTSIGNLSEGIYSFVLTVTDNQGKTNTDTVNITVANRILIDVGAGTLTASPDASGKYWNNMTDASAGLRVQNAVNTNNTATSVNLEVVNRIDGTYDVNATGLGGLNTIGAVGDYPVSATVDFAFAHPSAVNGNWQITGLDPLKQYTVKFWGTKSAADRFTQIKRSDETNWQEYDAGNNTDYNRAATFTFSGKTSMAFDIRVKDGYSFGYINVVDITMASLNGASGRYMTASKPVISKVAIATATKQATNEVMIYPNPSAGNFKMVISSAKKAAAITIQIVNAVGQYIYSSTERNTGGIFNINLAGKLSNGIYMVNCNIDGELITKRIMVNK